MVKIFPFRGIHYNEDKIQRLEKVIAPPYDVISPEMQESLYKQSDYNIIRLILGKEFAEDTEFNNRYIRASQYFEGLLRHNILVKEEKPCIYIYEEEFTFKGKKLKRLGFVALLRLEHLAKSKVFPHEETLSRPKQDRLEILKKCKANLESIFGLFSDEKGRIIKFLKKFTRCKPFLQVKDLDRYTHRIWKIDKKPAIKKIMQDMKDRWVFIADGHHRYEASLRYRDEMQEKNQRIAEDEPYNYIMMYFSPLEDKNLLLLPIHRLVKKENFDPVKFEEDLKAFFDITVFEFSRRNEKKGQKKFIKTIEKEGLGNHVFGMYMGGNKYYMLKLKDEKMIEKFIEENKPRVWKRLDVSILHSIVLGHMLNLKKGTPEYEKNIAFEKIDEARIFEAVKEGDYQVAFILNPPKVEDVVAIASKYERMPQKSTFFYPKLISGLVLYQMDQNEKIVFE